MSHSNHAISSFIHLPWTRPTRVLWSQEHPRYPEDAVFMTDAPNPHVLAQRLDWLRNMREATDNVLVIAPGARWIPHHPLDDSQLWDQFAIHDATRRQVKTLCRRYGFLMEPRMFKADLIPDEPLTPEDRNILDESARLYYLGNDVDDQERPDMPEPPDPALIDAGVPSDQGFYSQETYKVWKRELNALAAAELIYSSLTPDGDSGKIAQNIDNWVWSSEHYKEDIMDDYYEKFNPGYSGTKYSKGDFPNLESQLRHRLELLLKDHLKNINVQLIESASSGFPQISLRPPDLITGLWLQFSMYVNSRQQLKICVTCGQPFIGKNKNARKCSDACIQRDYRERKKAASVTTVSQLLPVETE